MERGRSSGRSWLICCFETAACTTAESAKPRISGQRISHPMASAIPSARMIASIIADDSPSQKGWSEYRPNDSTGEDGSAIPKCNERDGASGMVECENGRAQSSRDEPGDRTGAHQIGRRSLAQRPNERREGCDAE